MTQYLLSEPVLRAKGGIQSDVVPGFLPAICLVKSFMMRTSATATVRQINQTRENIKPNLGFCDGIKMAQQKNIYYLTWSSRCSYKLRRMQNEEKCRNSLHRHFC